MGMTALLLRVPKETLDSYLEDSSLLEERVFEDESEEADPALLDIDKSWDGIIFLLTGAISDENDHPLQEVLFSEDVIDEDQDMGYGPAHYLTPEKVKELNDQLMTITEEELEKRFDPAQLKAAGAYPDIWEQDREEILEYLVEHFELLKDFYAEAAAKGEAIITMIS